MTNSAKLAFVSPIGGVTNPGNRTSLHVVESTTADTLADLLARCGLNDQHAFKRLYELTASKLNGIAFRVLKSRELSSEVLQEAFIQIWRNAGEYQRGKAEPMTWMATIVRYRAYDRIKFESRRIEGAQIKADETEFDALSDQQAVDTDACGLDGKLETCLNLLNSQQKESILMAYYNGNSREEIADYFDTPVNTVKSWLRRGLARLQQCLDS